MNRVWGRGAPLFLVLPNRIVHVLKFRNRRIWLELILICEAEFGIVALDGEGIEIQTVGDAIAFLETKL